MICRPSYSVISGSCIFISSNLHHLFQYHDSHSVIITIVIVLKNLSLAAFPELPPALDNKQPLVVNHTHLQNAKVEDKVGYKSKKEMYGVTLRWPPGRHEFRGWSRPAQRKV